MLRGLGRSSRYWLGFDHYLSRYFRVLIMDARGLGQTTRPMGWFDRIEDLAADALEVLDQREVQACHVFGLSLGGMIGMAMAADFPERCLSLCVANSSTADSGVLRVQPATIADLLGKSLTQNSRRELVTALTTTKLSRQVGCKMAEQWEKIEEDEGLPTKVISQQLLAASRFRIKNRIDVNLVPTLILYGNQDRFVPNSNSIALNKLIVGSKLQVIRGAGHEISLAREEQLARILLRFTGAYPGRQVKASWGQFP